MTAPDRPLTALTDATAQHRLLIDHIAKLRTLPALKWCQAVIGLESNLGFEAQHALHSIRRAGVRNWVSLMEGVDGTCGLLTTNSSKEVMCVALQQLLSANRIHVAASMLSISLPPKEALGQMLQELRSFMIFVDPPKTLFAKVRSPYYKTRTLEGQGGREEDYSHPLIAHNPRSRGARSRARWAGTTTTWPSRCSWRCSRCRSSRAATSTAASRTEAGGGGGGGASRTRPRHHRSRCGVS